MAREVAAGEHGERRLAVEQRWSTQPSAGVDERVVAVDDRAAHDAPGDRGREQHVDEGLPAGRHQCAVTPLADLLP